MLNGPVAGGLSFPIGKIDESRCWAFEVFGHAQGCASGTENMSIRKSRAIVIQNLSSRFGAVEHDNHQHENANKDFCPAKFDASLERHRFKHSLLSTTSLVRAHANVGRTALALAVAATLLSAAPALAQTNGGAGSVIGNNGAEGFF